MTGGKKVVGLRRNEQDAHSVSARGFDDFHDDGLSFRFSATDDDVFSDPNSDFPVAYEEEELIGPADGTSLSMILIRAVIALSALAWIGFGLVLLARRDFRLPAWDAIPSIAATFSMPLVLLAVVYMLLARSSLGEASRYSRITSRLIKESDALDMRLAIVNQQLDTARQNMRDQASLLEQYGASASINLETAASMMAEHAGQSARHAETIANSGAAMTHQFGHWVDTMPVLEERVAAISATLADGSHALQDKVEGLEKRLNSLVSLTEEARSRSLAATQSLVAQLMQVQDATRGATDELLGMTDLSTNRVNTAVAQVHQIVDETSLTLDVRMADLSVLVDQSRRALDNIGGQAISSFSEAINAVETRLHELNQMVESQAQLMASIDQDLVGKIGEADSRFSQLEGDSMARSERLGQTLAAMGAQTEKLQEALDAGNDTAEKLISQSERLMRALDSSVRALDEEHPAALDRLNERVEHSRTLLAAAAPEIEGLANVAGTLFGRTQEAEELLRGQSRRLDQWLESSESAIAANHEQVQKLQDVLQSADEGARRLTESAGPQLVAALLRIKDTADQAGERARTALGRAISDAAETLGEESETVLRKVIDGRVAAQVGEISAVAERAIKAANTASDRLSRQLESISQASASMEQRIAEANESVTARDRDHFTSRSALLIEALNSAAIDVAKLLSGEVSDSSWAAYLKGDRGVFTRRAVRLIESGEAQSIAHLYDANENFRDHVNRYIHDFEAMLRGILGARDGNALAVTVLSSDMGKLYVALAQGIDRLRG